MNGPIVMAVKLGRPAQPDDPQLAQLQQAVSRTDGVVSVSPVAVDRAGTVATFSAIPSTAPSDFATEDLVNQLRDDDDSADNVRGTDLTAYVGGSTAAFIDLAEGDLRQAAGDDHGGSSGSASCC